MAALLAWLSEAWPVLGLLGILFAAFLAVTLLCDWHPCRRGHLPMVIDGREECRRCGERPAQHKLTGGGY